MSYPSGAVAGWAHGSRERKGGEPPEGVAFQPGMSIAQEEPPVVREEVRAMAGVCSASGRGVGVVGAELAVARRLFPDATIF